MCGVRSCLALAKYRPRMWDTSQWVIRVYDVSLRSAWTRLNCRARPVCIRAIVHSLRSLRHWRARTHTHATYKRHTFGLCHVLSASDIRVNCQSHSFRSIQSSTKITTARMHCVSFSFFFGSLQFISQMTQAFVGPQRFFLCSQAKPNRAAVISKSYFINRSDRICR